MLATSEKTTSARYEETSFRSGALARKSMGLAYLLAVPIGLWSAAQLDAWWHYLLVFLGFILLPPAVGFGLAEKYKRVHQRKRDDRAAAILDQAYRGETGPYCLYLRSFKTTGKMGVESLDARFGVGGSDQELDKIVDFEGLLAEAMEPIAPLVALGLPGEQFGVGRVQSSDDRWKQDITTLAEHAMLLIVLPSERPGTQWEIEWVQKNRYLHKSIFIMPPESFSVWTSWQQIWDSMCLQVREKGISLPMYDKGGLLFTIGGNGEIIESRSLASVNSAVLISASIQILRISGLKALQGHVFENKPLY
jgi:hypothetical protein